MSIDNPPATPEPPANPGVPASPGAPSTPEVPADPTSPEPMAPTPDEPSPFVSGSPAGLEDPSGVDDAKSRSQPSHGGAMPGA
jgi:hypothetical protein